MEKTVQLYEGKAKNTRKFSTRHSVFLRRTERTLFQLTKLSRVQALQRVLSIFISRTDTTLSQRL